MEKGKYFLSEKICWQELCDYSYIMIIPSEKIYFLKGIAQELWKDLTCGKSKQDMIDNKLLKETLINKTDRESLVDTFFNRLTVMGVIKYGK